MREVESAAEISPCGHYRYWLSRRWDFGACNLPIIMLNPSTADASNDDPTIRRCMNFARREGYGGIRVFNLFAYRATSPVDMKAADDPVGPGNDLFLDEVFDIAGCHNLPVLAAWGAHGDFGGRAEHVCRAAAFRSARMVCLGLTKSGHPRHPLYVRSDQPFEPYPARGMEARSDKTRSGLAEGDSPVPQGCAPTSQESAPTSSAKPSNPSKERVTMTDLATLLHDALSAAYSRGYREGCDDSGGAVDSTSHGDGVAQYLADESGTREVILTALRQSEEPSEAVARIEVVPCMDATGRYQTSWDICYAAPPDAPGRAVLASCYGTREQAERMATALRQSEEPSEAVLAVAGNGHPLMRSVVERIIDDLETDAVKASEDAVRLLRYMADELAKSEEPSEAVLAERERCAKVAENITYRDPDRRDDGSAGFGFGFDVASERIAAAIRQGDA